MTGITALFAYGVGREVVPLLANENAHAGLATIGFVAVIAVPVVVVAFLVVEYAKSVDD